MKRISLLCFAATTFTGAPLAADSLSEYIEPDAHVVISAQSPAEVFLELETHSMGALFKDQSLQQFIDSIAGWQDETEEAADDGGNAAGFLVVMKEEFGLTLEAFFKLFPGEISMAFYNITDEILGKNARTEGVILAKFSGDEERMGELMQIQFERNAKRQKENDPLIEHELIEEKFMGETLYMDEVFNGEETYIEDGYALVDGVFVLATEHRLRKTIELIKEGGDSILSSEPYQSSLEYSGRGDARLYFNLEALMAPLNAAMIDKLGEGALAMFGVTAQSMQSALSLESLQAFFIELNLVEEGLLSNSGILYSEKEGLLRLLTYTEDELPRAFYTPEGVFAASVSNFNLGDMISELQNLIALASPSVPMLVDIQLQQIKNETGIDLRAAVLDNLRGNVVSLSVMDTSSRDLEIPLVEQLYVIDIEDAEALSQAIEALKDLVPGMRDLIKSREHEGATIHTFAPQPNPLDAASPVNDISYVITRSQLILNVGRTGLLQEVLSRMAGSEDGFWQQDSTDELFEIIAKPNPVTRSYVDFEQMIDSLIKSFAVASSLGGLSSQIDLSKFPTEMDFPVVAITEANENEGGIFLRALLIEKEAE
ncbi:MAG: hypothetical protein ACON4O_02090 [Lentimonas sp.]